jgi:hypothetical protein
MSKTKPVYAGPLKEYDILVARDIITTLRNETRPIEGHPDHGAIQDCWNSLTEIFDLMAKKCNTPLREMVLPVFKQFDADWNKREDLKKLTPTAVNLFNYLTNDKPESKKLFAKPNHSRRDLCWEFVTPYPGCEILRWYGYDDANWWNNVVPFKKFIREDKSGRKWELDPTTAEVTLLPNGAE